MAYSDKVIDHYENPRNVGTFKNEADPNEFQEGHILDFPHAGVLTSPMFLARFPTTDTNRTEHA